MYCDAFRMPYLFNNYYVILKYNNNNACKSISKNICIGKSILMG